MANASPARNGSEAASRATDADLMRVRGLCKYFPVQTGFLRRTSGYVKAVDDVAFTLRQGETFGLVGESGCGKTTTGRSVLRAIEPSRGEILFQDREMGWVDVAQLDAPALRRFRRHTQMVFQDPYSALNPRMTLLDIIGEPLYNNGVKDLRARTARVAELLSMVGLRPEYVHRYPHAFSGGQRQRIGIARALALNPQFVVCDEPVSALDVSIQAQILNLLQDLQEAFGLTYLFVAHQLNVVAHICDRVAVMYVGQLVEIADTEALFQSPRHPYTEALLGAVPHPDPDYRGHRTLLAGEIANPAHPPTGCYFHPRCPYAVAECERTEPELEEIAPGRFTKCHRAAEIALEGIDL